jgi:hypothetical protein
MKKNLILAAVAASLTASTAFAQLTQTVSGSTVGGDPLSAGAGNGSLDGTLSLTVPQFNIPGATLLSVSYTIQLEAFGQFSITSVSQPANIQGSLTLAFATVTRAGGSANAPLTIVNSPVPAQVSLLNVTSPTGPHFTPVFTATSSAINDANLAAYTGTGTVSFSSANVTSLSISGNAVGSGEVTIGQTAAGRSATTVDVTYTYSLTEVPEPSTYAAMGFVGLVAGATIWRRRQMAKKA